MTEIHKLAVFGRPVEHSMSPRIHQQFAAQAGLKISYERVLVPEGAFNRIADDFLADGLGFNVTVPCKGDAYLYASQRSDSAEKARAVNTISVRNGIVRGDNTDGPGLVTDLARNLGWELEGKRVLVLGAGGAVSGVLPDLLAENPQQAHLHNRTHEKAMALAARFGDARLEAKTAAGLGSGYDLVINGTSAGLSGGVPALPPRVVGDGSRCYDMAYGAGKTDFVAWCLQQADCEAADGLGMLVEQAALSFRIWFGKAVETRPVIARVRKDIGQAAGRAV